MTAMQYIQQAQAAMVEIAGLFADLGQLPNNFSNARTRTLLESVPDRARAAASVLPGIMAQDARFWEVSIVNDFGNVWNVLDGYTEILGMDAEVAASPAHVAKLGQIQALLDQILNWYRMVNDERQARDGGG
jgi:hypothetical protein